MLILLETKSPPKIDIIAKQIIIQPNVITKISNFNSIQNVLFWERPEVLKGKHFEKELTSNLDSVNNIEISSEDVKSVADLVITKMKCENVDNVLRIYKMRYV